MTYVTYLDATGCVTTSIRYRDDTTAEELDIAEDCVSRSMNEFGAELPITASIYAVAESE